MIITRTPFRISFFGGGTDYPAFYRQHGGSVLSTTINKYCYVMCRYLPPFFEYKYRIRYSLREETQSIAEIKHPSVRECLNYLEFKKGTEIQHNGDLPAMSGIGSSSAFTVGLLNALYALKGEMKTKRQIALDAIHIEQDIIQENVGSQDQAAAAFGGFNRIDFGGPKNIMVNPITIDQAKRESVQNHLMLFFTGFPRNASQIAAEQIRKTPEKMQELKSIMDMVDEAVNILNGKRNDLIEFGKLLNESWRLKRSLTENISTTVIDDIYETGLKAGAVGGKILGAGGGGFILFFAEPEVQPRVREKLKKLLHVPFKFHDLGSQIVYYAPEEDYEESY
jgi:D-glycero-alpha-D-manno-heptose-7-phosphate kinase